MPLNGTKDELNRRIERAVNMLHPLTSQGPEFPRRCDAADLQQTLNDVFNILEWGKTDAEEAKESAKQEARDEEE